MNELKKLYIVVKTAVIAAAQKVTAFFFDIKTTDEEVEVKAKPAAKYLALGLIFVFPQFCLSLIATLAVYVVVGCLGYACGIDLGRRIKAYLDKKEDTAEATFAAA